MHWRRDAVRLLFSVALLVPSSAVRGDEFDRLGGATLAALLRDGQTRTHPALDFRELEALPTVLRDTRSALLIVKTDQGNLAQLLVSPGFRKRPGGNAPLVPLLLVERFEVFDSGNPGARLARGKNLTLFPGFQLDLDTGQVVPEGMGGDLVFTARGDEDGVVSSLSSSRISTLERAPSLSPTAPGIPSEGRIVRPADFSGRFRLSANGQWSGLLELAVDPAGSVTGSFQSDASGSAYPVTGKVDPQLHQKVQFAIQFPRARQDYQGVLWTEGKQVVAGTLAMLGQDFSFVAVREGSSVNLGADVGATALLKPGKPEGTWLRVRVEAEPDRYLLGQAPKTRAELTEMLTRVVKSVPGTKVMIVAAESTPYERVRQALEAVQAAGVATIRLAPSLDEP
jgi:biopolymer transport protein ExbD